MKTLLRKNTWLSGMDIGWGNGYVIIPKGNPLHGVEYDDIKVNVHGGLTFSELITEKMYDEWELIRIDDIGCWMVGFDTAHSGDNAKNWDKCAVEEETELLKDQLEKLTGE